MSSSVPIGGARPDESSIAQAELCEKLAAGLTAENHSRNTINVDNVFGLGCRRFTGERIKEIIKFLKNKLPKRFGGVKLNGKNKEGLEILCFSMFAELTQDIQEKRVSVNDLGPSTSLSIPIKPVHIETKSKVCATNIISNKPALTAQYLEEEDEEDMLKSTPLYTTTTTTATKANNYNNKSKKQKIQHMTPSSDMKHRYYPIINSMKKIQIFNTIKAQPGITDNEILDAFTTLCTSPNDDDVDETSILMLIVSKRETEEEKLIQAEIIRQIEETDRIILTSESDQLKSEENKRNRLHSLKHECNVDLWDAPEFHHSVLLGRHHHKKLVDELPMVQTGSKSLGCIAKFLYSNACKREKSCVCDPSLQKLRSVVTSILLVEADAYKYWKESCLHYLSMVAQRIDSKCNDIVNDVSDTNNQIMLIDEVSSEYEQLCKILYKIQKVAHAIPKAFRKADPFYNCTKNNCSLTLDGDGIELVNEISRSSSSSSEEEQNYVFSDDE